ncbi:hypothetical protein K6V92_00435 [Cupriavidus respiraculi]|uniref:hypothetical protein n=1 Tax=Cupriavidus respiraculi TaxID=195930 RepID=UPI001C98294A|nr:hypothetical protein [Cupriavidus respiraculi]MBY4945091.1 hypothetical protein [Cupriavidus respiraculi]
MAYSEEVAFVPGSVREPAHLSHQPARVGQLGHRTPQGDALAFAALERARALLAAHRPRNPLPRWY